MNGFPRTVVGGVSVSRMIIGTNWFLGFSHCTKAKSDFLKEYLADYKKVADIIEVFMRAGVDTIMGLIERDPLYNAVQEAEQRVGRKLIFVSTPSFKPGPRTPIDGWDMDQVRRILDINAQRGAAFLLPHTSTTDAMLDHCSREIRQFGPMCAAIRERGMVPGLSTHLPEAIVYADEKKLDVETYIAMFNAMGFLMPIEVDWVTRLIQRAKKPVMTIKPMAAGQLRPLQGMSFAWNNIRDCDMVTVGTMTPAEAQELVDLSLAILERRPAEMELQGTRSKESVMAKA